MKNNKKTIMFTLMMTFGIIMFCTVNAYAAPSSTNLPNLNISVGDGSGTPQDYVSNIKILIFFTILSLLPSIVIMATSFTRIVVVFSFLKSAMGVQQAVPNQILTGLAIFLTLFIMNPVYSEMNTKAIQPYLQNSITQEQAIDEASKPLKEFLLKQTREKDLQLFIDINKVDQQNLTKENVPFTSLIPAFAISELKTAFQIGFLIYLPFLVIDMVVSSVLMAMGMFMLPPTMVSLPFKLILFVMVDGWYLLVKSLIQSFM
ncbi:flagellar type III secretion system pore protein FliP [Clostridium saccharobutylicum]|nr:flagellar type III secretion system pore protein FliP [Clostridium saccharobutylicum]AQR92166.1 flagellar biosynthetic protein FliP precursor [Clostridium saccharobutylicum]AQS02068.1 flagellar biosynthetic protein FliP precursor [Clostridium saccharobutylicum]AQS11672.1 flagellar biosynthetic protein FliP precursor [Clostridium saccharobutylicum]AQS16051.1 flagellar biosynthetic protein FliP precursor [Clostridium saccharobutylicum]MBA2903668.1 flagellar biosynthetic protein FliP [Clostrid